MGKLLNGRAIRREVLDNSVKVLPAEQVVGDEFCNERPGTRVRDRDLKNMIAFSGSIQQLNSSGEALRHEHHLRASSVAVLDNPVQDLNQCLNVEDA